MYELHQLHMLKINVGKCREGCISCQNYMQLLCCACLRGMCSRELYFFFILQLSVFLKSLVRIHYTQHRSICSTSVSLEKVKEHSTHWQVQQFLLVYT